MAPLLPCEHCRRHVFASERACRFCGSTLARPLAATLAVVSALGLATCAPKYGGPPPPDDDSPRVNATASASASASAAVEPPKPDPGSQGDVYGGPPPPGTNNR
jgi:hypothetical protein